ncbi:hypothetical protein CHK_2744 [Christensenella hongkongensis]|uniref:Uncharacterized protein n=1 Tax=Christensenella hongkongensis TaxID=270498 RepID=A0A0M2NB45_9FIRM|nr:hypothetical protein CHK_2744 [Christensenella hongkongensis]
MTLPGGISARQMIKRMPNEHPKQQSTKCITGIQPVSKREGRFIRCYEITRISSKSNYGKI